MTEPGRSAGSNGGRRPKRFLSPSQKYEIWIGLLRGEFSTIPTTLPGVRIADQLPLLSRQTDKFSIIRGHVPMSESHGTADSIIMTGRKQTSLISPCHER